MGRKKTKGDYALSTVPFVRFQINIFGADGIQVQYPYGWIKADKVVSFDTVEERMDYILGFAEIYDDYVRFNGDTQVARNGICDGTFDVIGEAQIYDFTNGKEYFSDASFNKLVEWCEEYDRKIGIASYDDKETNPDR